ncbi:hypothetical protein E2C01_082563 [Portunus trituberculatus]|uniref:Uncharacterized protein n=1 Tax=Portunus trituberculatus TaxID=210409 RepID=A0A5B7IQ98_PORTR|nr:hypothetical protein [Portunus trituberculatus]
MGCAGLVVEEEVEVEVEGLARQFVSARFSLGGRDLRAARAPHDTSHRPPRSSPSPSCPCLRPLTAGHSQTSPPHRCFGLVSELGGMRSPRP